MSKEDTQHLIGKVLDDSAARDAIHIAVLPVICDEERIYPGQALAFVSGQTTRVQRAPDKRGLGIADPYLKHGAGRGERFFLFLYPNTVTGLRHVWTHEAIPDESVVVVEPHHDTLDSERWIRNFAEQWNFDYRELISNASDESDDKWGNYIVAQGIDLHNKNELGQDHDLFWMHLERLTGKQFGVAHREKFGWSCSC